MQNESCFDYILYAGYIHGNQTFVTSSVFLYSSVLYWNAKHIALYIPLIGTLERLLCCNENKHLFAKRKTPNSQTIVDKNRSNTKVNKTDKIRITQH